MKRLWLTAGLAAMLGCRGAPLPHDWRLPGGEEPVSFAMRNASVPRADEARSGVVTVSYEERRPTRRRKRSETFAQLREAPATLPEGVRMAYAADHRWLVGPLSQDPVKGCWRLRYAAADAGDRYGGELELLRVGAESGLRVGQVVRVEGRLVDPAPHEIKPAYEVRSLESLAR